MRRLVFGIFAVCQLAVASQAAATCASPQEVKALQAAALEQQLAAAAQSCHLTADYGLFVAKFRDPIVRSDRAVRVFFQHRKNSEGYDLYKSRIAQDASLHSLHDPQFCRSAKTVFDIALGRGGAAKSPVMVQTGYEHCKAPSAALVRTIGPIDADYARHALALAKPAVVAKPAPVVIHAAALIPVPTPRVVRTVAVRAAIPARATTPRAAEVAAPTPHVATAIPQAIPSGEKDLPAVTESRSAMERPQWRSVEHAKNASRADQLDVADLDDPDQEGRNVPSAYRPGAVWVGAEASATPLRSTRRRPPPMVMGPDGRWYVFIGHQETWQRE